ncbi:uncharacterized protein LOC128678082 isoform X2 [Plodia interpunctella]|uniref:uncharacterized protein LOC128678082 isoform X2 n=1 Tax=Plodia interpunctella TaxID=58824 RepID=UPI002368E6F4|nr:uncharacterized protein LOC128678082 isoform X2 [Plodia interpunctella]
MNSGRSDASTSTDDVKARPLCLFYFTHPFGVLSPEPPLVAAAPAHVARAYVNMQPVSPFFWNSTDEYNTNSTSDVAPAAPTRLNYDLGKATVHKNPVNIVSVARTRKCTIDLGATRDTISSSLFSSDVWFSSGSSSRSFEYSRRVIPYHRILPPLQLPPPRDSSFDSSDDVWPSKCINPEKFSLPPIELPVSKSTSSGVMARNNRAVSAVSSADSSVRVRCRRRLGVVKHRRTRLSGVRRLLTCLTRRTLRGACGRSLRLQDALATLRAAWAEPVSLLSRQYLCRRAVTRSTDKRDSAQPHHRVNKHRMLTQAQLAELAPRGGASPGLLRRRYSVPETIMRKYKLAQQRSESEEAGGVTSVSPASASPPMCESPRSLKRDRELMRKSALLRRMWGRPHNACCCSEVCECCGRETRSLDTSRSELRPLSCSSGAAPPVPSGWATPKRQRLDSSRDFRGSDEMLRTAMRNSYDKAEESRYEQSKHNLSDSSRSYGREISSCIESMTEALSDSDSSKLEGRNDPNKTEDSQILILDSSTMDIDSSSTNQQNLEHSDYHSHTLIDDHFLTDESESYSVSMSTTKENQAYSENRVFKQISSSAHIEGRISERSVSVENDDTNMLPYDTPLTLDTPSCELLEIVVSESFNSNKMQNNKNDISENRAIETIKSPVSNHWKKMHNINIDEYVSNILVESLNSLTDQIECMNASMSNDRKVSIVEKEIKVKLQNTGVNTIVHLSPKSNNQIIFGNEELCNSFDNKDDCNNPRDSVTIRDEPHSAESNNNPPTPHSLHDDAVFSVVHNDNVNRAVLQQIQKLFQDELKSFDNGIHFTNNTMPGISHIEISNVDVFIDNNTASTAEATEANAIDHVQVISGVGAGNYFLDGDDSAVVPRFSAMPHTDSMEVNTSSSDDADNIGSDCTSLVDSLDDPNSPRSVFLRKHNNNKRNELVRSAIDVLDLLPENSYNNYASQPKDKGEAFFIRIKDNNFDCEKENVIVADHMPEKIKQRLYRRQRKREMRMECARRSKVKQLNKEMEKQSGKDVLRSREVERECIAVINALIDEVIVKIVHDEHKCLRIKQKNSRMVASKSDENVSRRTWKKDLEYYNNKKSSKIKTSSSSSGTIHVDTKSKHPEKQIHGKLSLLAHPPLSPDTSGPRRIYQKSEIHDGNKCIEILEILEYVNSSHSQSSPDITNSDENQNGNTSHRKSRIPIPVYERKMQKNSSDSSKPYRASACKRPSPPHRSDIKSSRTLTSLLLQALAAPERRASVPVYEPRSRSNSLRFKQMFDMIPEERSSLSVDSSNEDVAHNRRSSAPSVADTIKLHYDDNNLPHNEQNEISEALRSTVPRDRSRKLKEMRSAGTSPLATDGDKMKNSQITTTSPNRRSAATSPMQIPSVKNQKQNSEKMTTSSSSGSGACGASGKRGLTSRGRGWLGFTRPDYNLHEEGPKEKNVDAEMTRDRRSVPTDPIIESQRTVRTIQTEIVDPIIVGGDKHHKKSKAKRRFDHDDNKNDDTKTKGRANRTKSESREIEEAANEPRKETRKSRQEGVRLPECVRSLSSSSSSESGGSLLCALAPHWLYAPARRRHAARRLHHDPPATTDAGGWSVTVAGSCRAALPADVEMRLRFPPDQPPSASQGHPALPLPEPQQAPQVTQEEWSCVSRRCPQCACACCTGAPPAPRRPPSLTTAPAVQHNNHNPDTGRLTLTMKKEALGSSVLASKTAKKSSDPLPDLETYTATRSKVKSSVKAVVSDAAGVLPALLAARRRARAAQDE